MGYACPVCETPQRDGEHLANHLAFTAMLHGDDHEDWLDEHVDGWGGRTPAELAGDVTEHATEAEYDEVFEDTTGGDGEHGHGHGHDHDRDANAGTDRRPGRPDVAGGAGGRTGTAADETVESVLAEARELTEEMYEGDADDDRDGDTETDGGE